MVGMKMLDIYLSQKDYIIKPALEELATEIKHRMHIAEVLDGGIAAIDLIRDRKEKAGITYRYKPLGQIGLRAKGNDSDETVVFALIGNRVILLNLEDLDPAVINLASINKDSVKRWAICKLKLQTIC